MARTEREVRSKFYSASAIAASSIVAITLLNAPQLVNGENSHFFITAGPALAIGGYILRRIDEANGGLEYPGSPRGLVSKNGRRAMNSIYGITSGIGVSALAFSLAYLTK